MIFRLLAKETGKEFSWLYAKETPWRYVTDSNNVTSKEAAVIFSVHSQLIYKTGEMLLLFRFSGEKNLQQFYR